MHVLPSLCVYICFCVGICRANQLTNEQTSVVADKRAQHVRVQFFSPQITSSATLSAPREAGGEGGGQGRAANGCGRRARRQRQQRVRRRRRGGQSKIHATGRRRRDDTRAKLDEGRPAAEAAAAPGHLREAYPGVRTAQVRCAVFAGVRVRSLMSRV